MTYLSAAAMAQQAANWAASSTAGPEDIKATNLAWAVHNLAQAVQELAQQMHRDNN